MKMKKTMLNAVQKVKMAMGKKMPKLSMEYPKMNKGFDSLPSDVQNNIMKKKPKMSKRQAIIAKVKKEGEAKVSAAARAKNNRIGGRSVFRDPLPPKMAMRKKK
jgi:hypothetical protein|tara:strand:+ start:128 stop:439 length:312 start_codon:yes stop_codon:yes gene_type:complete